MNTEELVKTLTPVLVKKAENSDYVRRNLSRVAEALLAGDVDDRELLDQGSLLAEKAATGLADIYLLNQWFGPERVKLVTYERGTADSNVGQRVTEWLLVERKNGEERASRRRCAALGLEFLGLPDVEDGAKPARKRRDSGKKPTRKVAKTVVKRPSSEKTFAKSKKTAKPVAKKKTAKRK